VGAFKEFKEVFNKYEFSIEELKRFSKAVDEVAGSLPYCYSFACLLDEYVEAREFWETKEYKQLKKEWGKITIGEYIERSGELWEKFRVTHKGRGGEI